MAREWQEARPGVVCQVEQNGTLPASIVEFFSDRLGHDIGRIRVHSDRSAAEAARLANARAFVTGRDIVFAKHQFRVDDLEGIRLIAHEVTHVIQQRAVPRCGTPAITVGEEAPVGIQRQIDPAWIWADFCPPGTNPKSYGSSGPVGTAYGTWLALMYMRDQRPQTYGLYDFWIWTDRGSWKPGTISDLYKWDPGVSAALLTSEWTRRNLERTDILNSDLDEVYEIKPVRSAADGPAQLALYLTQLSRHAPTTSLIFGPPRPRIWSAGNWDPSPYRLVVPGVAGKVCFIHAWRDAATRGLLVYDLVCCEPHDDQVGDQPVLFPTAVKDVVQELKTMRPQLEAALQATLPKAPRGAAYAFLATPRFFAAFVKRPWETAQDRLLEKAFGTQPGPVLMEAVLTTFLVAHFLPGGVIADYAAVSSGFMTSDQIIDLYEVQILAAYVGAGLGIALVGAVVTVPELIAAVGEGVELAPELVELAGELESAGVAEPLAAGESLGVDTAGSIAEGPLIDGVGTGEAIEIGRGASPWLTNPPPPPPVGSHGLGLGVVAAAVVGLAPAEGQAGTIPPVGKVVGVDALVLAPTELLVPKRGKITLGAEVTFGQDQYYVIALAATKN